MGQKDFQLDMETTPNLPLPEAFLDFLKENDLDPSIYVLGDVTPRYIRLKPGGGTQVEEIEADIKCMLEEVSWLPGFFSIPPHIQIANSKAYQEGKIYGMDAASGAAVLALNVSAGDHVLDLCAAPGAKLCMLLDLLGSSGSVTGVDVARHRLAACRTMLQKYGLGDRCRLFVADGTTFSLRPLRGHFDLKSYGTSAPQENNGYFKEWTSKRSWKERKIASKARIGTASELVIGTREPEMIFYGKHSGVVGLTKSELFQTACGSEALDSGYDKLQLLSNGFRLLKVGGSLVYSTCSLTVAQNEDIVEQFLSQNAHAVLQEIDAAKSWPCRSGRIPNTLRFDPLTSQTSGLFVAKFTKLAS
ncbi:PREDICTED: uncharacterized protein LOC104610247 isoform X3 [Nelumbo nucifera]|uniref:Uncharacterized protein LOC104610247 isoform X3 n=1 Tax=Nelumbo nucifera TaxID=4432 RepID=A0A1U8BF72_NELNU|nr:PREDICTED: uncharacterized protein LOC104610247 isoform X3 [Nelumbo nucifera]